MPSARAATQPLSASAFRWRLTVDCGSCTIAAQLGHGQLVAIEQQQNPAAGRVRERGEVIEDRRRRVPFIR